MKIGYLVPEFPGQTHNFFKREVEALERRGIVACFVSTRRPPIAIRSTSWGKAVEENTDYLFPFAISDIISMAGILSSVRWGALRSCFRIARSAENGGARDRLKLLVLIIFAIKLATIARSRSWSHVHVHSCADAANTALFAKILFGLTYSLTLHNPIEVYGGNQKQKWKHARFGVFITDGIMSDARTKLEEAMPPRAAVAPMGVDVEVFRRKQPYRPYTDGESFSIFCCARLNHAKGHDHLIRAVTIVRSGGIPVVLEIAGEDDVGGTGYRAELERLIGGLNAASFITLRGAVSEEEVRNSMERCHLFVLASLEEPLGVAIMEAMAMELPVIATDAGGVPGLIKNGVNGLLVEPAATEQLAEAIMALAQAPSLACDMGKRARRRIEHHFSSDVSAELIARLLQQTMISPTSS